MLVVQILLPVATRSQISVLPSAQKKVLNVNVTAKYTKEQTANKSQILSQEQPLVITVLSEKTQPAG
jgi:hypothetical protein